MRIPLDHPENGIDADTAALLAAEFDVALWVRVIGERVLSSQSHNELYPAEEQPTTVEKCA